MKRLDLLFFLAISFYGRNSAQINKDSFLLESRRLPVNYKGLIADAKGWQRLGYYVSYGKNTHKIILEQNAFENLAPFRKGKMFSRIRGHRIIARGDKRGVLKITYLDGRRLILTYCNRQKKSGRMRRVKTRILYQRVV